MRIKEWYSWHFPELKDIVKDNYMYARVIKAIQSRAFFQAEDCVEKLKAVVLDEDVAQDIVNAGRASMGQELNAMDLVSVNLFADKCVRRRCMIIRVIELCKYREDLFEYLQQRMHSVAPNLSALIGEVVGARLISHSGSLVNLAKSPASTIQILGAEKALFRALKTRSNTPKYGIIFHSSFIGRAGAKNKGRISRYLANKCSIASRLDSFSEEPTDLYGLKMKEQVEQRLNFYETGVPPQKNADAMLEVAEEIKKEKAEKPAEKPAEEKKAEEEKPVEKEEKKKEKKEKKEKKDKKKEKKEKKDKKEKQ